MYRNGQKLTEMSETNEIQNITQNIDLKNDQKIRVDMFWSFLTFIKLKTANV